MHRLAASPFLLLPLLACGAPVADMEQACFELPQALAVANGTLNQGINMQGTELNGRHGNGGYLNGRWLNGRFLNGRYLNGGYINSKYLNAGYMNGKYLNAGFMNGKFLNGGYVNGKDLNGQVLNGWSNGLALNGWNQGRDLDGLDLSEATGLGGQRHAELDMLLDGSRLVLTLDGEPLPDEAWLEVEWRIPDGEDEHVVRVTRIEPDASDERLVRYALSFDDLDVCDEGAAGLFLAGSWDEHGDHDDSDPDGLTFACPSGVLHKCVNWGYQPWAVGEELHQTCTRLARADYCGTGTPWTKDGTLIDVYDVAGVQSPTGEPGLSFEAGWGPIGAVCVSAPRYLVSKADGDAALPACWDDLPRCADFDMARLQGALLGNDSAHTPVEACH